MKVIDNRIKSDKIPFLDLKAGDAFEFNDCIYIKGHQLVGINAFNCYTNSFVYIDTDTLIKKVSAKLILSKIIKGED